MVWRAAGFVLRALGLVVASVLLLVLSVFANLDTGVVRRVVADRVNRLAFDPLFQGTFTILSIGHVDPFGVSGVNVVVRDPTGKEVLRADGVHARIATHTLLRTLLGWREIVIDIGDVHIAHADVLLDRTDADMPLVRAFLPKPSPPSPGRGPLVRLSAPHVFIEHASGHGQMSGLPYFDGEVTGLSASFELEPERIVVEMHGGKVLARGIAQGKDAAGSLRGHLEVGIVAGGPGPSGSFAWEGTVGAVAETVSLGLEHGRLDGVVDVRDAAPDAIRAFWPESPLTLPVSTHLDAHGPFDAVVLAASLQEGDARLDVAGTMGSGKTKHVAIHLDAARVDLHQWIPLADASLVGVRGDVEASLDDAGRLEGGATLEAPSGYIGKHQIPPTKLSTHGFRERTGAFGGDAMVEIAEPGAPTTISLHATPVGTSSSIAFSIASHGVRLGSVTRVSTEATGTLRITGKGNVDLDKLHLDASLDTHGAAVRRGDLSVGEIDIRGQAHGHLLNPEVTLGIRARNAAWGARTFSELEAQVTGKALTPHIVFHERSQAFADVDADGDLDLRQDPTVHDVTLTAAHGGETLGVELGRATFSHGNIGVKDLVVRGLGGQIDASGQ
jgi:hypothetical protein